MLTTRQMGVGNISITEGVKENETHKVHLHDVLYSPSLGSSLMSVPMLNRNAADVTFTHTGHAVITRNGIVLAKG